MKSSKKTSNSVWKMLKAQGVLVMGLIIMSCNNEQRKTSSAVVIEETKQAVEYSSQTTDEILVQEKAWAAALVAGEDSTVADLATVDSILHRDFRLKGLIGNQMPVSKEMYLGMTGMSATLAEVTSVKIVEEMGTIAVARVTWTMDWSRNGVKLPPYWDMIDTWMKREDGTWQVLSRLSQPVDKPYDDNQNNQ